LGGLLGGRHVGTVGLRLLWRRHEAWLLLWHGPRFALALEILRRRDDHLGCSLHRQLPVRLVRLRLGLPIGRWGCVGPD